MPWEVGFVASGAIALPYFAISWFVARGLAQGQQLRTNRLGLATALIFFSCGMGHALHAVHLLEAERFRQAVDVHMVLWDISTAAIAIWYLSLRSRYGQLLQGPAMFEDLTRVAAEERAHHDARHDHLTGLPNRPAFMEAVAKALDPETSSGKRALLFVDLDRFKVVNDTLGHVAGDALLIATAARLSRAVRPNDLVARLAGDEFVVLLAGETSRREAIAVTARLSNSLHEAYLIAGETVNLTCSAGIALAKPGEVSAAKLLHRADAAMYRAKENGRARWELYGADLAEPVESASA